jgi:4-amino-4-deoxy-L-arabinose transferase-like glycosyltransferase
MQALRADWLSAVGLLLYPVSIILLLVAWARADATPPLQASPPDDSRDAETATDWWVPRWVEAAFVVVICALALAFRLYNLDYLQWGIHGDEGEAATNAFDILDGNLVSPFTTGWYAQPNVYYWSIAAGLKVFGSSVFGLRMSTVVYSMLALPFFYLLVRRMFGVRAAFLATGMFASSVIYLHYSRVQFSNITTPVFWVIGFYFLFRGLQTRRMLDFALSAITSFFSFYFYNGSRILPFMLAAFFLYMVIFQRGFLRRYFRHLILFGVATYLVVAPFIGYYLDHQEEMNARTREKLIFSNPDIMQSIYGAPAPVMLPAGIEITPSTEVHYLWGQLNHTLSMFTYRATQSSIFGFTGEPIINFVESALLVLGVAMAAWRWRDARFALLLIWFWAPLVSGGVLTIEAPYSDRVVGMFPTIAIFVALTANKVIAEGVALWRGLRTARQQAPRFRLAGAGVQIALVAAIIVGLGVWNLTSYFGRYLPNRWQREDSAQTLGQTLLVQEKGTAYKFYEIGEYRSLNFNNGTTRFVRMASHIDGRDLTNLGDNLPFWDSDGKDVIFIMNNTMLAQLAAIRAYYPEGTLQPYSIYNNPQAFLYYTIPKEQIAAKQVATVTYGATGSTQEMSAKVPGIGTEFSPSPPKGAYPVSARWSGGLFTPAYMTYTLKLEAPEHSTLVIDDRPVLTVMGAPAFETDVFMARGLHSFALSTTLANAAQYVSLQWRAGDEPWSTPTDTYLWDGPMGTLRGELYPYQADAVAGGLQVPLGGQSGADPVSRRLDSALDWRDVGGSGDPTGRDWLSHDALTARWRGTFIAPQEGEYIFDTFSNGDSGVWIDGQPVVLNTGEAARPAAKANGAVELSAGQHSFEARYNWANMDGALVVYVTMPGSQEAVVVNGSMFTESSGVWLPGEVPDPPASNVSLAGRWRGK